MRGHDGAWETGRWRAGLAALLLLVTVPLASPARAQSVAILDGDKISIDGTVYRLLGIDAPDSNQVCDDGYPAGKEAIKTLLGLMKGRRLVCENSGRDPFGRTLALCRADGRDLGEQMVRAGMAWATPVKRGGYADVQHDAEAEKLGVHDHACVMPQAYRKNPQ
jgi:endonuclease YncB( thermonuclease family)